jgi:3-deoxy-D-manno-octulosonic-acid transferase
VTRLLYTALAYFLLPYAWLRLHWRSRREAGYSAHIAERFGHFDPRPAQPVIWLHAVSLGETRGAEPLINALIEKYPEYCVLLTHMTPTGREAGQVLFGNRVAQAYLPYDTPGAVARFLQHFAPRIGLLMETEIWPNLIRACQRNNTPLLLVNARLSERSARAYARVRRFTREVLSELTAVVAQSGADAQRFTALGATRVSVAGNLKFDIEPPAEQIDLGDTFRAAYGKRPVMLAASTREGEEDLVLDAAAAAAVTGLLVVMVPRHPQRFEEVAKLIAGRGLSLQRRSLLGAKPEAGAVAESTQVVLGDSLGELFAYYRSADLAFVGGSLVRWGGHNLIEACAAGTPVLVGPHTMNFAEATASALTEGAAMRVADADELAQAMRALFADPERRGRMHTAALAFAGRHRGATTRTLAIISPALR